MSEFEEGRDADFAALLIDSHICPDDLTPDDMPSRVGPYEVIEPLGRGRDAQAYLAREPGSERAVALKHFERESPCSAREVSGLSKRLQALSDPAIVPIRAILRVEDKVVACMDYVVDPTLADRELPLRRGLPLLARVARTVNGAHQAGLVHGDLRPGNILLGPQPRILDLGLATLFPGGEVPFGSPAYLAPELVRGEAPTPASDVYALGALLYELLCGYPPFDGVEDEEVLARLKRGEAPRSPRSHEPSVPRPLERIALQALARDPKARQESAGAFAEDLETWNAEVSPPVVISGRWVWVALAVGVPLALVLASALLGPQLPAPTPSRESRDLPTGGPGERGSNAGERRRGAENERGAGGERGASDRREPQGERWDEGAGWEDERRPRRRPRGRGYPPPYPPGRGQGPGGRQRPGGEQGPGGPGGQYRPGGQRQPGDSAGHPGSHPPPYPGEGGRRDEGPFGSPERPRQAGDRPGQPGPGQPGPGQPGPGQPGPGQPGPGGSRE